MPDLPTTFDLHLPDVTPSRWDNHIQRRLSSMRGQYHDPAAFEQLLAQEDVLLYEVYELARPHQDGELLFGISVVHPGHVGDEYFMTKGHFHAVLETAEVYHCLKGEGFMVMEDPEGNWVVESLAPGRVLYVPPRWAHRTVNTGVEDVATLFIYPANAGHNYGAIEQQGFRKLVLERAGRPQLEDNPRWLPPGAR